MSVIQTTIMQPSTLSSPTLATPKPSSITLKPSVSALAHPQSEDSQRNGNAQDGDEHDEQGGKDGANNDIDGRMTPTADGHSNPSLGSSSSSNVPSPNPTTISILSQPSTSDSIPPNTTNTQFTANIIHPAEMGFGNLQSEEQLKSALQSKDRMFLLVLSKEFESFINKLSNSQIPSFATNNSNGSSGPQTPTISTSIMASLTSSTNINVTPTSKFQRMLVYKTAEWYGLKAVPNTNQDNLGGMIVGVLGDFDHKSTTLKLSELVPTAPSANIQTQKFKIMQRASTSNGRGSGSSSPGEGSTSSSGPKWKTLEEREAAYAAAREKIYGKPLDPDENGNVDSGLEAVSMTAPAATMVDDEIDPVPRQLYQQFDVVYPSLYHPPKAEPTAPPPIIPNTANSNISTPYPSQSTPMYGYPSSYASYAQQMDTNGYPMMAQSYGSNQSIPPSQPQQNFGMMPNYMDNGQNGYMMPPQQNGYPVPIGWQHTPTAQHTGYPGQMMTQNQQQYGVISPQQNSMNGPQAWQYPTPMMSNAQQQQHQQPQQPMPMIPQGVQYPTSYGYPQIQPPQIQQQSQQPMPAPPLPSYRQGGYPPLAQPTPMRPPMQPHSSASSSRSSRSYQDGSRPHSRGSTTSTRSAASSVRLGAMYPASEGPGYRQRAMKGQGMNGLTSLGFGTATGPGMENRRSIRGHSPSSTTTTSSRTSSRRTSSIQLVPPSSQHQLPSRPDWAANNVPYHPSPLPIPGSNGHDMPSSSAAPSAVEFPPLLRQGQGTNAEPMQVERVKIKASDSVWNGPGVKNIQQQQQHQRHVPRAIPQNNGSINNGVEPPRMTIIPGPVQSHPHSRTPGPGSVSTPPTQIPSAPSQQEIDPDFPRRIPTKTQPTLYDPSMPRSSINNNNNSRPSSVNTNKSINNPAVMTAEDIIEAKLAQISINSGIPIGAPASNSNSGSIGRGENGVGKSYAKVLRRD